jgi:hypothetical protein
MRSRGTQFDQLSLGIGEGTSQTWQPAAHVTEGAARFSREQGRRPTDYTGLDTMQYPERNAYAGHLEHRAAIGQAPTERTLASYDALRHEVGQQFAHLTKPESQGGMGFKYEATEHDPYPSAEHMAADVANKRIKVLSTKSTGPHSVLSDEENDQLRAVHDVFGHAATGRGFSRHGEEAAYQAHAQMFSPAALPALGSELRHQTSHLAYTGSFPPNAATNLSDWSVAPKQSKTIPKELRR